MSLVRKEEVEGKEEIYSLVCRQTKKSSLFVFFFSTGKGHYIPGGDKPAPVSDSQPAGMFAPYSFYILSIQMLF